MKIGCIIQGDIRRGTNLALEGLTGIFDYTVLSTWEDDYAKIPSGKFDLILNKKPCVPGSSHRNFQRYSTARGLEAVESAGCHYVMKWRTDMLPTKLSIDKLIQYAQFSPPPNTYSRIVIPAFRNISIYPDAFSSIPDLFAFGHITEMKKLWRDEDFDYTKNYNIPLVDLINVDQKFITTDRFVDVYCAEAELYNLFRNHLNQNAQVKLSHKSIIEKYFYLINHNDLDILWFDSNKGFRSIGQAWEHPWWTVRQWKNHSAKIYPLDHNFKGINGRIRRKLSKYKVKKEILKQEGLWQKIISSKELCLLDLN